MIAAAGQSGLFETDYVGFLLILRIPPSSSKKKFKISHPINFWKYLFFLFSWFDFLL